MKTAILIPQCVDWLSFFGTANFDCKLARAVWVSCFFTKKEGSRDCYPLNLTVSFLIKLCWLNFFKISRRLRI